MKVAYRAKSFRNDSLVKLDRANRIIAEYSEAGYVLTLRQLFYQFVAREWLPNTQRDYRNLGGLINDGRMAGVVSWSAIEDRTRYLRKLSEWTDPQQIVRAVARQYREDVWMGQRKRIEVWIEKDALVGVIEGVCNQFRVPYLSCRGYMSASEMREAAMRVVGNWRLQNGRSTLRQNTVILHLGDHDPSGLAMTDDIQKRLDEFCLKHKTPGPFVKRIALTIEQIRERNPPPNTAKESDPRWPEYQKKYGDESWELDALPPDFIANLVRTEIEGFIDEEAMGKELADESRSREGLWVVARNWDAVSYEALERWPDEVTDPDLDEEEDGSGG